MNERLADCFAKLPEYLGGHLMLSVSALLVGLAVSLPLGIAASRRPRFAEMVLGAAGVIQTVPSLALLALMVPLLGQIGFEPAFIALTLYSILPILANTILGIKGVDPALTEAARGLGMSDLQMLRRVELPLAAPVIIGGIRTATVLVVGTATLVTPVGGRCLGNYIFSGLNTGNQVATVFGCVAAALLAVVMDQVIRLFEAAARLRSRALAWAGALGLLLVGVGAAAPLAVRERGDEAVGSLDFTEQHILSNVLTTRLRAAGFRVVQKPGLLESIQFDALREDSIGCCVDYSGNLWTREMKRTDVPKDRQTMIEEIDRFLRERCGVVCLGSLGFENAYALAVPEGLAARLKIRSIADLCRYAGDWEIAGDNQIFEPRLEWREVKKRYGLRFTREIPMDPTLMYQAVGRGKLQVICAYTSDGRIRANHLRLLQDPQHAFPPYDALLLVSRRAAGRPGFVEALRPLVGAIDLSMMQKANMRVDVEQWPVQRAAEELYEEIGHEAAGKVARAAELSGS